MPDFLDFLTELHAYLEDLHNRAYWLKTVLSSKTDISAGHLRHQQFQRLAQVPFHICSKTPVETGVHQTPHVIHGLSKHPESCQLIRYISHLSGTPSFEIFYFRNVLQQNFIKQHLKLSMIGQLMGTFRDCLCLSCRFCNHFILSFLFHFILFSIPLCPLSVSQPASCLHCCLGEMVPAST